MVLVQIRDNVTYMGYWSHSMAIAISIIVFILENHVPLQYFLMFVGIYGRRSLVGYSPWVANSRTRLSDFTFFHFKRF